LLVSLALQASALQCPKALKALCGQYVKLRAVLRRLFGWRNSAASMRLEASVVNTTVTSRPMTDGVEMWTLEDTTGSGVTVRICTLGAVVQSVMAPDREGTLGDVVLGFDDVESYRAPGAYFGAIVGRVANRIEGAAFTLDGVTHRLAANNGPNTLHGGNVGFDKRVWAAACLPGAGVELRRSSPDGEEGFPGAVDVVVRYELHGCKLQITLEAHLEKGGGKATPVNLAGHSYFNLAGHPKKGGVPEEALMPVVDDHRVYLNALAFTPVGEDLIPTGELQTTKPGDLMDLASDPKGALLAPKLRAMEAQAAEDASAAAKKAAAAGVAKAAEAAAAAAKNMKRASAVAAATGAAVDAAAAAAQDSEAAAEVSADGSVSVAEKKAAELVYQAREAAAEASQAAVEKEAADAAAEAAKKAASQAADESAAEAAAGPVGFDHNFVLASSGAGSSEGGGEVLAAVVTHEASGRTLEVRTSAPGVQFYTGNFLGAPEITGKGGARYGRHSGLCLETQHFPSSVSEASPVTEAFAKVGGATPILRPGGAPYRHTVSYTFGMLGTQSLHEGGASN